MSDADARVDKSKTPKTDADSSTTLTANAKSSKQDLLKLDIQKLEVSQAAAPSTAAPKAKISNTEISQLRRDLRKAQDLALLWSERTEKKVCKSMGSDGVMGVVVLFYKTI